MNRYSIVSVHFIKLVNADDSTISQHKSTAFKIELPGASLSYHWRRQASSAIAFSGCVHACEGGLNELRSPSQQNRLE